MNPGRKRGRLHLAGLILAALAIIVLAVGPGKMMKDGSRRPLQVREGDRVLFTAWAGDEFKEKGSGEAILVMHEEDVLAVVDK